MNPSCHYFFNETGQQNSSESHFLLTCNQVIIKHLENPGFDTQHLASQMNLSRSQLTRKLKIITGKPPGRYLLETRLIKAKFLLEESRQPIKNVAILCGFSSYTAFWQAFYKYFGRNPSAYADQGQSNFLIPTVQWDFPPGPNIIESLNVLSDNYDWFSIFLRTSVKEINNSELRLEDLASEICYSPSQLLRNFKRLLDVTPMSFIKQLRLLYAIDLIRKKDLLITEIAYKSGFSDQAHLCRSFKAHCGISISTFRKTRPDFIGFSQVRELVMRNAS